MALAAYITWRGIRQIPTERVQVAVREEPAAQERDEAPVTPERRRQRGRAPGDNTDHRVARTRRLRNQLLPDEEVSPREVHGDNPPPRRRRRLEAGIATEEVNMHSVILWIYVAECI